MYFYCLKNITFLSIKKFSPIFYSVLFFPFLLFAEEALKTSDSMEVSSSGINFLSAVLSASIVVQITFLILVVMSVVSWAIILQKYFFFKETTKSNSLLENVFLEDGSFEEIYSKARSHEESPLAQVFISGYNEMQKILKHKSQTEANSVHSLRGLDNLERALRKASENELSLMENGLGFLATVGSSGPFIGLFGTVFGIMNSFNKIAVMGLRQFKCCGSGHCRGSAGYRGWPFCRYSRLHFL